jgi:hypothetical protein
VDITRAPVNFTREDESAPKTAIFPKNSAGRFAMSGALASPSVERWRGDTEGRMILRLWRGWTTPDNAGRYEELIASTIFPGIVSRGIAGLEGLELFRRWIEGEVEFMTLMRFASWEAVKAFAGPDWEVSVVPAAARAVLARFDEKAAHYELGVARSADE